jgi:hypothetical protein
MQHQLVKAYRLQLGIYTTALQSALQATLTTSDRVLIYNSDTEQTLLWDGFAWIPFKSDTTKEETSQFRDVSDDFVVLPFIPIAVTAIVVNGIAQSAEDYTVTGATITFMESFNHDDIDVTFIH